MRRWADHAPPPCRPAPRAVAARGILDSYRKSKGLQTSAEEGGAATPSTSGISSSTGAATLPKPPAPSSTSQPASHLEQVRAPGSASDRPHKCTRPPATPPCSAGRPPSQLLDLDDGDIAGGSVHFTEDDTPCPIDCVLELAEAKVRTRRHPSGGGEGEGYSVDQQRGGSRPTRPGRGCSAGAAAAEAWRGVAWRHWQRGAPQQPLTSPRHRCSRGTPHGGGNCADRQLARIGPCPGSTHGAARGPLPTSPQAVRPPPPTCRRCTTCWTTPRPPPWWWWTTTRPAAAPANTSPRGSPGCARLRSRQAQQSLRGGAASAGGCCARRCRHPAGRCPALSCSSHHASPGLLPLLAP